jgi:hypothetical protein
VQVWDFNPESQWISPRGHPDLALEVYHEGNPRPTSYGARHEGITLFLVKADDDRVYQVIFYPHTPRISPDKLKYLIHACMYRIHQRALPSLD